MKVSEFIDRATAYLVERGHCKATMRDSAGRVCLQGAMLYMFMEQVVESGTPTVQETREGNALYMTSSRLISRQIEEETGTNYGLGISEYNDLPETTQEDVLRMMRRASAVAKERGL